MAEKILMSRSPATSGQVAEVKLMVTVTRGGRIERNGTVLDVTRQLLDTVGLLLNITRHLLDTIGLLLDITQHLLDTVGLLLDITQHFIE
jgi:hypothetical protein